MAVRIYDSGIQAYKDDETPKIQSGGVWIDTDGKSYDDGVWKEDWSATLQPLVPNMTSDTTPSGQVIYASQYGHGYYAWNVFSGDTTTAGTISTHDYPATDYYVGYVFPSAVRVRSALMRGDSDNASATYTIKVQASSNGSNWGDISDVQTVEQGDTTKTFTISTSNTYRYYRLKVVSATVPYAHVVGQYACRWCKIQFFG